VYETKYSLSFRGTERSWQDLQAHMKSVHNISDPKHYNFHKRDQFARISRTKSSSGGIGSGDSKSNHSKWEVRSNEPYRIHDSLDETEPFEGLLRPERIKALRSGIKHDKVRSEINHRTSEILVIWPLSTVHVLRCKKNLIIQQIIAIAVLAIVFVIAGAFIWTAPNSKQNSVLLPVKKSRSEIYKILYLFAIMIIITTVAFAHIQAYSPNAQLSSEEVFLTLSSLFLLYSLVPWGMFPLPSLFYVGLIYTLVYWSFDLYFLGYTFKLLIRNVPGRSQLTNLTTL